MGREKIKSEPLFPEDKKGDRRTNFDGFGSRLSSKFEEWKHSKREIEEEWLSDLRAFNSSYSPEERAAFNRNRARSRVFVGLTRTKVMAAYSRIIDLLLQSGEKPWSIGATPVPELAVESEVEIKRQAIGEMGQFAYDLPESDFNSFTAQRESELREVMREEIVDSARASAEQMELEVEDQLVEGQFEAHLKSAILEMCVVGNGAIKGATMRVERETSWAEMEGGWEISHEESLSPQISAVSVFDLYPDPYAISIADATGIFERHVLTRAQLRELGESGRDFDSDTIEQVIRENESGTHSQLDHEIERRQIAGLTTTADSGRFDVLEYWGQVDGHDLMECGCQVEADEVTRELQANVWICGGRVIKAQLNPYKRELLPYQIVPYERIPHQFWGVGVARMMRDSQVTMNTAVRVFLDNLSISSGPQVEINLDLLDPGEDPTDLHPWKVWLRSGGDSATPMLRFYQPTNVSGNLGTVIELFRRFADEETSLPSYTHGQQMPGLNKTASGMSMLMGAANVVVKSVIKNIDDFMIRPLIQSMVDWNMQWSEKDEIKGDLKVVARGSTALVAREIQSQRLIQFMEMTANPVDATLTDREYLLRSAAESMDIDAQKAVPEHENPIDPTTGAAADPNTLLTGVAAGGGLPAGAAGAVPGPPGAVPQ